MSSSLSALQPALEGFARDFVQVLGQYGYLPRVTSTLRTQAEQERLYRRRQQGLQAFPVARPGTSAHEFGWAFDLVVTPLDAIGDAGALWESWGGVWGGRPTRLGSAYDPVHFEYPGWRHDEVDLRSPYNAHDLASLSDDDFWSVAYNVLTPLGYVLSKVGVSREEATTALLGFLL